MTNLEHRKAPPDDGGLEISRIGTAGGSTRTRLALGTIAAGIVIVVIAGISIAYWPTPTPVIDKQTTSSTTLPGSGPGAGTIDNNRPGTQPKMAPVDRSDNVHRGINSIPDRRATTERSDSVSFALV